MSSKVRTSMRSTFTGVGTALVTPFTKSRRRSTRRRCAGWRGVRSTPASTSSCRAARPARRRRSRRPSGVRVVEIVVDEAAGRAPVLAGAGGYDTREVIHAAAEMQRAGAQGILSVTPYYNKPTQEGLYQHYQRDRREHAAADRRLQRAGPHRLQRRAGDARAPRDDPEHRRREGSVGQHHADGRDLPRRARRTSSCCRATMR